MGGRGQDAEAHTPKLKKFLPRGFLMKHSQGSHLLPCSEEELQGRSGLKWGRDLGASAVKPMPYLYTEI